MEPNTVKVQDYPTKVASSVTVDELKVHLGLFGDSSQDDYLANLILAAEGAASNYIGYDIGDTIKKAYWGSFLVALTIPDKYIIGTPVLKYFNSSNVETTVSTSLYVIDTTGTNTVLRLKGGENYPTDLSTDVSNPVVVDYASGFDSSEQSAVLDQAVMMYCKEAYDNRGITTDKTVNKLPLSAERLLAGYRRLVV